MAKKKFTKKDYAAFVDRVIDDGVRLSIKHEHPYDIKFFARSLWYARPFFRQAARGLFGKDGKRLMVELVRDCAAGRVESARMVLLEMDQRAQQMRVRMPWVTKYPVPAALRRRERADSHAALKADIASGGTFSAYVDTVLTHAKRMFEDRAHRDGSDRRYDVAYYAQVLWRAKAFLEYAPRLPRNAYLRAEIRECHEDFLGAVYEGDHAVIRAELREMTHLASKLRKQRPDAPDIAPLEALAVGYPTPKLLLN